MSLEQTIDNLQIRNANMVTFVGTSNTMVDTTTGRIQTKGIQHNSNVITDVSGPHGRIGPTLKKYPEIAFESGKFDSNESTNTYVQAGYTVSASSQDSSTADRFAYQAFNEGATVHEWRSDSGSNYGGSGGIFNNTSTHYQLASTDVDGASIPHGEWLKIKMPKKIRINSVFLKPDPGYLLRTPEDFKIYGSNDGTTWKLLITQTGMVPRDAGNDIVPATTISGYYDEYAIVITKIYNNGQPDTAIEELEFYGYEEDPPAGDHSVDTTFKSRFNNAQTTGVQVLVDGATGVGTNQISGGPDPSGNQSTYVTDGKYWTLNGTLTSNLAVEANTFLEGDQPHAVSVWFNSSNLEANVSNTCVFSIASEEKLDSVNLDLQSNTWHNLTYAYQGEGGSRVTYLDGRKVSEDQAEDTFGVYPPFAMTGYTQGGYVVSASSEYNTTDWLAYNAFSDGVNHWYSVDPNGGNAPNYYDGGDGVYTGPANLGTYTGGYTTIPDGEWIRLEMPHKLKLSYVNLECPSNRNEFPSEFYVYGSNDDKHWDQLYLAAFPQFVDAGGSVNHSVNAMNAYKYLAIVATRSHVDSGANYVRIGYVGIGEIKFYGHRENDLVRLPDPTNVLKYPHITMTGPAQRGYVASASSFYSTSGNQAYQVFDNNTVSKWASENAANYNGGSYLYSGSKNLGTNNGGSGTENGEWVMVEMSHKIKLQSTKLLSNGNLHEVPDKFIIYGSNDITGSWSVVDNTYATASAAIPHGTTGKTWTVSTASSSSAYRYFGLVIRNTTSSTWITAVNVWELYGTGVDSIPIQIGGGNIDKVANFRVYDRFIEEDQVNEIWNAQKEEFGRAKPQMVLQQGKLGIGTDAPQGSLSVADEPHNLEEFPPRAMTAFETYMEGHGVFKASVSSYESNNRIGWRAFDKLRHPEPAGWGTNGGYTWNTGVYNGSAQLYSSGPLGEWIQLESPYGIIVSHIIIGIFQVGNRGPQGIQIVGSNNGVDWYVLVDNESPTYTGWPTYESGSARVNVNSTTAYKYHAMIARSKTFGKPGNDSGNNQLLIRHLKFFGTREQGQSVLHDGQLTLTKSLNVPRIGPPLDADDTPRRDRLVVEYNTSTNPTFEGAVRDTSGRGNDGMFRGGAFYSDAEKALVFDGDADYVESPPLGWSGAQQHSVSVWIKLDLMTNPNSTSIQNAWTIVNGGATNRVSHLHIFTNGTIEWAFNGNNATTGSGFIQAGTWYHIVCVYNGGAGNATTSRRMWINGDEKSWNSLGSSSTLNLEPEATFALGYNKQLNNYDHDGSVSNAKLYDVALTAQEVKTLYDMGRCDEGHHTTMVSRSQLRMGGENIVIEPHRGIGGFYEEGTWVPIIHGSTSGKKTPSSANKGWWVRVGNLVTIGGTVHWDGGNTISGLVKIGYLPYKSNSATDYRAAMNFGVSNSGIATTVGQNTIRLVLDPGQDAMYLIVSNEYRDTTLNYSHYPGIAASGVIYGIGGTYMI